MSDKAAIEKVIDQFFQAIKTLDWGLLPLTDQATCSGTLLPKAAEGAVAVRNYLSGTAPFIKSFQVEKAAFENSSAAFLVRYEGINGVSFEGCYFMDFEQGKIARIRTVFDSRPLTQGD